MILTFDRSKIIKWLVFCFIICLPLSWAAFGFGSFYRMLTIVLFLVFLLTIKGRISIQKDNQNLILLWCLLAAYALIMVLFAENFDRTLTEALGMLLLCGTVLVFAAYKPENAENQLDYIWILSGAICLLLFLFGERSVVESRETLIILGTPTDNNEFAGAFIVPIALGVYKLFQTKKWGLRLIYLGLIVAEIYAILLTGSRGALLGAITAIIITILLSKKISLKYLIVAIVIVVLIAFLVAYVILPLVPQEVLDRFTMEDIQETGGSGRAYIWEKAWKKISSGSALKFLFGYGSGAGLVVGSSGARVAMHNQFLQMLANYGLVGLILYISLIVKSFKKILRGNRQYVGGFFGMMALSMTLSMPPSYKPLWVLLMMSFTSSTTEEIKKGNTI